MELRTCPWCGVKVADRKSWDGDLGEWVPALYHEDCGRKMLTDRAARAFKRVLDERYPLPPGQEWKRID